MVRAPPAGHTGYPTPPVHATREVVVEIGSELRRVDTPAPRASSPATMRQTAAHLATSRAPDEVLPAEARAREEARDGAAWGPPGEQNDGCRASRVRQAVEAVEAVEAAEEAEEAPPSPPGSRTRDQPTRNGEPNARDTTDVEIRSDGDSPPHIGWRARTRTEDGTEGAR